MDPIYFTNQEEFRKWLEINHEKATEIIVGFYKVGTKKHNMTWSQSVDQALCFGWIDGIRRSVDKERYCIRFTPRKPTSIWSDINIRKIEELKQKGLMRKPGLEAFDRRKDSRSGVYSYENGMTRLDSNLEEIFKANKEAWAFFIKQAPSYQKTRTRWVMSARQEKTRMDRLNRLIALSADNEQLF